MKPFAEMRVEKFGWQRRPLDNPMPSCKAWPVEIPNLFSCEASSSRSFQFWRRDPSYNPEDFSCGPSCSQNASSLSAIIPRGHHPFPSRTRKLSPAGPIVLHAKVCGRVGRRRHKLSRPRCESSVAFFVPQPAHRGEAGNPVLPALIIRLCPIP